jgi:predicted ATPase
MLREMADAIATLASDRTVVLVLEDLHWGNLATIEWLAYLARRREPARLLVLATSRSRDDARSSQTLRGVSRELRAQRLCLEVELGLLPESDVARWLATRLGVDPPPELSHALHVTTGGNPLFLNSIVDELARRRVLVEEGVSMDLRKGGNLDVRSWS